MVSQGQEVVVTEIGNSISAHIPDVRATAELSKLTQYEAITLYGLGQGEWYWFNRLINQSGIPRMGTLLLDAVLEYCKKRSYSILNQVNAYGDIGQKELEDWYIRKGFTPVDYGKYKNALLKWQAAAPASGYSPEDIEPGILPLVTALNEADYETLQSCEGHSARERAYVAFKLGEYKPSEAFMAGVEQIAVKQGYTVLNWEHWGRYSKLFVQRGTT